APMDRVGGGIEKFRIFKKEDFEADWIKVTERSFGQVYRVKLKLWRDKCALKSFDTIFTRTSFFMRMIEEASKMEKVTFKYIYGVCNDPPGMVMEYMSNGSLDHLLTSHMLMMWPKKFQTVHEATMDMNFLHSMKPPLLHLILKPSNILLHDHLHIKISDFGLIKWEVGSKKEFIENLTARGNICYIPPETFTLCPEHPGTKFDVYGFSVVMWEILTLSRWEMSGVEKISDDKPHESEQMITIMQRCWDQDPRDRLTSQVTLHLILQSHVHLVHLQYMGQKMFCRISIANCYMSSHENVVRLLLTRLGSADEREELHGRMVLHVESVYGHLTITKLLLSKGVDHTGMDHSLTTALHLAAEEGHNRVARQLVTAGAGQLPGQLTLHPFPLRLDANALGCAEGEAHQGSVDLPGKGGWTPLHLACHHRQKNVVSKLLAAKADPNVAEDSGWTALHLECNGRLFPSVLQLIMHRANVNAQNSQATPLHLAPNQAEQCQTVLS
uniref:Ankyrin repeat and kinase domain containing 1 n=1 Tax=Salmo trutta TaxID=8032 RepID=A0A673YQE5_SALTR